MDKVAAEEAKQKRLRVQMEEQKRQEEMLKQRMQEQEEQNLDKKGSYASLQEEVNDLDRKLKAGMKQ